MVLESFVPAPRVQEPKFQNMITFERERNRYRHWRLEIAAPIATLTLAVDPDGAAAGDYQLKLNSYDIGVDIELADAVRRIRFEHPEIRCVVITGGLAGTFCAGANIGMLASANHSHKVNFCKFTNETRLEIEDASANSGIRFLAAVNGACSGGGYELALACDHILLLDDRNTAVSLPEVPLLGVLPGTGGLTRLTDKRHVRRDRADVFATKAEGMMGAEALAWNLVDSLASPTDFDSALTALAVELAGSAQPLPGPALNLEPLGPMITEDGGEITYRYVKAVIDRDARYASITVEGSSDSNWLLTSARELDDLLCHLRFNESAIGTLVIGTYGDAESVRIHDQTIANPTTHGQSETALLWRRVLQRLDLTARSIIAAIEPGSCFVGILAELALAADRTYMLDGIFEDHADPLPVAMLELTPTNLGSLPMMNGLSRLRSRLWGDEPAQAQACDMVATPLDARMAAAAGLVTFTPDDLDWDDELRLAIEERAAFSPDALSGMEANHRFCGPETMATKIFARLSAWQNWIFIRPNASGPDGALRRYGSGARPDYSTTRT
jgi:benzoyl-CoA-dihydrodiol lyase